MNRSPSNAVGAPDAVHAVHSLFLPIVRTMGNSPSSSSSRRRRKSNDDDPLADVVHSASKVVGRLQQNLEQNLKNIDTDHPAALLDSFCGYEGKRRSWDDYEEDSRTVSEEDTEYRRKREDESYISSRYSDDEYTQPSRVTTTSEMSAPKYEPNLNQQPLASSFAKKCYFTKAGIGSQSQHYEGLTLSGNVILMLASAMQLKGCPTICDEDLRRVEQIYPNQFSRLPDELLLSSGWRRISKYCSFSLKPIPDGIPFFHSKERLNNGGFYFLLTSAVGMVRPIDVEPLSRDTLVLLETDYPGVCDTAPRELIQNAELWNLVDKFCFFSGGPINVHEDVYYVADFDGNNIYMLAFLSPSLTPEELYKLNEYPISKAAVFEVESVYDLTERDFDDLKLYHLGPCRALPDYVLNPAAWQKVLPPNFVAARETALLRAAELDEQWEEPQDEPQEPWDAQEEPWDQPPEEHWDQPQQEDWDQPQQEDWEESQPWDQPHDEQWDSQEPPSLRMYDEHEEDGVPPPEYEGESVLPSYDEGTYEEEPQYDEEPQYEDDPYANYDGYDGEYQSVLSPTSGYTMPTVSEGDVVDPKMTDSNSEMSSVWTESRNSRRALILQMARARMKHNKENKLLEVGELD